MSEFRISLHLQLKAYSIGYVLNCFTGPQLGNTEVKTDYMSARVSNLDY